MVSISYLPDFLEPKENNSQYRNNKPLALIIALSAAILTGVATTSRGGVIMAELRRSLLAGGSVEDKAAPEKCKRPPVVVFGPCVRA